MTIATHTGPPRALPLIAGAMLRPEMYPDHPASVELRQTHVSFVFLAGDCVYKIKKPVRFSFLDASTLARRRQLCLDEVRFNRRLAPDVYLGVVAILCRGGAELALGEASAAAAGAGAVVEWAVRMRRLEDATMLDRMVAGGAVSVAQIRVIAARLAAFHGAAATDKGWQYGSAASVWRLVRGNLEELALDRAGVVTPAELEELERFAHCVVEPRWSLLNRRALGGRVCEGHGDLRCEHVSLAGDTIAIIDCVEFSEGLRYVDVASDVGFLAMDLDRLGARGLSDELVGAYREASGDADLPLLIPFYKIHRALVRAKVESLTSRDLTTAPDRRAAAAAAARRYVELALDFAGASRPAMVVVCGLSGSGKSTVARRLADRLGFEWLRSDEIRKHLAGAAPTERLSDRYGAGAYSREFTSKTYAALLGAAAARLGDGAGVIVDATFAAPAYRAEARALAARAGRPLLFVECAASHDEIVRRLTSRARSAEEVSDAGVATYLRQRDEFAALSEIPQSCHLVADTERGLEAVSAAVVERLGSLRRAGG
ncbi:MAG TPA: AAA family ATPase [Candidatus Binataceae bacterium]|nr:AAA family ATPase [Candidatus Binataceae bacterium]